jgi:monoamine oxidase
MGGPEFATCTAMGGRLLWTATETAAAHAGHMEGALQAAERTVKAVEAMLTRK